MSNKYCLSKAIVRLLRDEAFFASFSRRIDKTPTTAIPTAAICVNEKRQQFEMLYNPEFMSKLSDDHQRGVLMHEFYHVILEHVTRRKPIDGIKRIDNIAMDLAINGLPEMRGRLPDADNPGPEITPGQPMMACVPGQGPFADLPPGESYEWYLEALKNMIKDSDPGAGDGGDGGEGDPLGGADSFDSHEEFGEGNGAARGVAEQRLKGMIKKAAEDAQRAGSWGSISSEMRKQIMESINPRIDWRKVLRYFVKTSQRSDRRSTPRRLNRRFPRIHPGKRVRRHAKIAISIDQSGSVGDDMLAAFFAELNSLANIAEFTVIPFDTRVAEDKVFVWKKGESRMWERVLSGGTCFDAPTRYVNEKGFDGHIILTDMCAPKPISSNCQRMWMTTPQYADSPYFKTKEAVIAIKP